MDKLKIIETVRINNPVPLATTIYHNFVYLKDFPHLGHSVDNIITTLSKAHIFLIYHKNRLVAYSVGEIKELSDNRMVYYVHYIYVLKKYRGQHIGSYLIDRIIRKAMNIGLKFVVLTCDSNDKSVYNFYIKRRFVYDPSLSTDIRHCVLTLFL